MDTELIIKELRFAAVRSGGPGGQHANKVSSKIQLSFNLNASKALTADEKDLLKKKLKPRLTKNHILNLYAEESRSQHQNKEKVVQKFLLIIQNGLKLPKPRKTTRPSKASVTKRLEKKKKHSFKKALRKKINYRKNK